MGSVSAMTNTKKIDVIGLDVIDAPLSEKKHRLITNADVVIGGMRHLESVKFFNGRTICITGDIRSLIDEIHQCMEKQLHIVVLATGDPLLFGIGNTLIDHFGINAVTIHPGISTVQAALSRLGLKTHETVILSRHGNHDDDLHKILHHHIGVILTFHAHSPVEIIHEIMEKYPQTEQWQGHVCQCLGMANEIIQSGDLKTLSVVKTFQAPNLLVVENPHPISPIQRCGKFGRPDDVYEHDDNMITHPEIRAIVLSKLRLDGAGTVWDVGAGSGSVGIEAAQINPYLKIFSIEKNAERYEHIAANAKKHKTYNLYPVRGNASEVCLSLPAPDRVFIGGGGEDLSDLLALCYKRLSEGGVMVVNTVTIESLDIVRHYFRKVQKEIEAVSVQVSRMQQLSTYHIFKPENPITIFGIKK
jgi:precorrin-6Y C5,15-methyltransferase (decarboxylating)